MNGCGTKTRLPTFHLQPPSHLHIDAETPQLGLASAFAMFDVMTKQVSQLGYEIQQFGSPLTTHRIAYVSPTPRSELSGFTETVAGELRIGSPAPVEDVLEQLCKAFRLESLLFRRPEELSGGETAKVILTAHLARLPDVLILDRVLDELDQNSRIAFHVFLKKTTHAMVVVTTGSNCNGFPSDAEISINGPQVMLRTRPDPSEFAADGGIPLELVLQTNSSPNSHDSHPIVSVCGMTVRRANREVLVNLGFTVKSGDLCWLLGPNGCGKSTLLEALCGLVPTTPTTEFRIFGSAGEQVESNLARMAAYAPQDPDGDVTELTLMDEVRLAQQAVMGARISETATEAWLDRLAVSPILRRLPLSDDVQNRKLASVLAAFARNRPLVLLDEPTLFLDKSGLEVVSAAIATHLNQGGAVICATHDPRFRQRHARPQGEQMVRGRL